MDQFTDMLIAEKFGSVGGWIYHLLALNMQLFYVFEIILKQVTIEKNQS
jgi:hypothetical protein